MNAWKSIFLQSRVNDGCYEEDKLPQSNWDWPKETWFQSRLGFVREHLPRVSLKSQGKLGHRVEARPA
jgi:hypothetical protein